MNPQLTPPTGFMINEFGPMYELIPIPWDSATP